MSDRHLSPEQFPNLTVHLKLPATSANLGPAFDTAAVAISLYLEVTATAATEFSISATGRNADICSALERNLQRPVLTANQALLWSALRAAGLPTGTIERYGLLFAA